MQDDQRKPESSSPEVYEIVAAGFLGMIGLFVAVVIAHEDADISGNWRILVLWAAILGAFTWIGGSALLRPRTWTGAGKMAGAMMVMIGMITVITGHSFVGSGRMRRVARDADIDLLALGLTLLALSFLVDAILKRKRT